MRESNYTMIGSAGNAAKALVRVVPLVMQAVRAEMRACRTIPLSVPQFRALFFIGHHADASLSDVATHVGATLPSMSRLIDGLVERSLVTRCGHAGDRRRLILKLTGRGQRLVRSAHAFTESAVALRLSVLDDDGRATVIRAMALLHPLFVGNETHGKALRKTKRKPNGGTHA